MLQEICIIEQDNRLSSIIKKIFKEYNEYRFYSINLSEVEQVLKNIPSLIIINEEGIENEFLDLCKKIRDNEDNSITPIILVTKEAGREKVISVLEKYVEYYIVEPLDEKIFYLTIRNILRLLSTNRRVSPLTGLPGNVQIQTELKKRLLSKKTFAVFYLDLDNFKAYNDVYGFLNGDEIIKFTGKILTKNINSKIFNDAFVGHIGGDDFVAITSETDYEKLCEQILNDFAENIKKFFNKIDMARRIY